MAPAIFIVRLLVAAHLALGFAQAGAPPQQPRPAAADPADVAAEPDVDTQLFSAAMLGDVTGIQKALAAGASANATADSGSTAHSLAALHGKVEAVNELLAAGASVTLSDKSGATPLYIAAAQGQTRVVGALAAKGGDVNAKDRGGITVLMAAASANRVD